MKWKGVWNNFLIAIKSDDKNYGDCNKHIVYEKLLKAIIFVFFKIIDFLVDL